MEIIGLLGALFGAGSLIVAIRSKRKRAKFEDELKQKQKKFEKQLEEKEELRELGEKLKELNSIVKVVYTSLSDPSSDEDLWNNLEFLSKEVISYEYSTDKMPKLEISNISTGSEQVEYPENAEQALRVLREEREYVSLSIGMKEGAKNYGNRSWGLGMFYFNTPHIYDRIEEVQEYEGLLNQFNPDLIDELEEALESVIGNSLENMYTHTTGVEIHLGNYSDTDEIREDLFEEFLAYKGYERDLEELSEIIEEIENTRTTILQTSYS